MRNPGKYLILVMFGLSVICEPVQAGEVDVLLEKLVEKGVLSPVEASVIKDETVQTVAGKSSELPDWVQKMKLKGDLRIRVQLNKAKNISDERVRGRIRFRLGIVTQVAKTLTVGAGLATGGTDPRSTNDTLDKTFETPDIRLDYAYAEWSPSQVDGLSLVAGKFPRKKYLWNTTDLLWDGDINPEGGSVLYKKELADNVNGFASGGVWIMDDLNDLSASGAETDPFLVYLQTGLGYKKDIYDAKFAVTKYAFNGVSGASFTHSADSNTLDGADKLIYDYDSIGTSSEFGIKEPFDLPVERLALFADTIFNYSADTDEDFGFAFGLKFGDKSVSKPGSWQFKYIKAKLERDAWLDTFPDSDRFDGMTNVKSHEFVLSYALMKNVVLGLDYYYSTELSGTDEQHVGQFDVVMKF